MEEWSLVLVDGPKIPVGEDQRLLGMGPKSLKKLIHNNFL